MRGTSGVLALLLAAGCAAPRSVASAGQGKEACAQLMQWAAQKAGDEPPRSGESSALEDSQEAAACFHRNGDEPHARAALLIGLVQAAADRKGDPLTVKTGAFDDSLARSLAALAFSSHAANETEVFEGASKALAAIHGRTLDLDAGDRTATGAAGTAISMIDGACFFCARADVYGAQDREHVELLGSYAGIPYVRRDDGREQFLQATRLLADGEQSPRAQLAEAMRRRGKRIDDATISSLAKRAPEPGEERAPDAPLFRLLLRGFAFGLVEGEVKLPLKSDVGDLIIRFPNKLLQRAGRDHRFVAPPDGVDAVVRYEGRDGEAPIYRAVILRHEDGVAEGP